MNKKIVTTEILEDVVKNSSSDTISLEDIITAMDSGGFGLIMTIFSLPIIIPLPPPLPSFIAFPILVLSFQMIIGYRAPILPKILAKVLIKRSILAMIVEKSSPHLRKVERLIKPRFVFMSSNIFKRIIGIFCFSFAVSILIPLPFSNFLPGIGVLLASFGLVGRDGLIIILGLSIGCMGIVTTMVTIILGVEAVSIIKDMIFS